MSKRLRIEDITDYLLEYIDNGDITYQKHDVYDSPVERVVYTFSLNDNYKHIKDEKSFDKYISFAISIKNTLKRWNLDYTFTSSNLFITVFTTDEIKNITYNGSKVTTNSYLHKISFIDNEYTFNFQYRRYYASKSGLVHVSFYLDSLVDEMGKVVKKNDYQEKIGNWNFDNILSIIEKELSKNNLPFTRLVINRPVNDSHRLILDFKFDL